MKITYTILPSGNLEITCDPATILEMEPEDIYEALEWLTCNAEFSWIAPCICGDLTDAPMLAILGPEELRDKHETGDGTLLAGTWGRKVWVHPVVQRWGYMSYQVKDPLDELKTTGRVLFQAP